MECLFSTCLPSVGSDEVRKGANSDTLCQSLGSSSGVPDDAYRREELKQLVGIFASRAQKFLPCTQIDLESNQFKKARYRLDPQLRTLTVECGKDVFTILLAKVRGRGSGHMPRQVKAVYGFEDLQLLDNYGPFLQEREIVRNLSQDERDRLAIIEYTSGDADTRLVMLEQELETSDPLITVLRILQMYAGTPA
ncbi:glucose-6-phosphate isomerase [Babesia caballi]|uniref:Glucose-6-phosphate isomerase n=1 Tax=Babesia caballi TaxID=5871 RepID=A0AAV4LXY3_BABCB|nr:glucose-6-phosphate isomerase [Babesia caballi]